ncbi:hypothetical protein RhiJN_25863 [Ceratobasidium sp. AG-Ba]|nr:hypothetical protein RhiJN_25863 [Ceratobasidium sp. AG-Ba]
MPPGDRVVENAHLLKPHLDDPGGWGTTINRDLEGFGQKYNSIRQDAQKDSCDFGPHTRFALTSQYTDNGEQFRVKLQPEGIVSIPRVQELWDVDSVIVFLYEGDEFPLPAGCTLYYTPMNHKDFTLQHSLHLPPIEIRGAPTLDNAWLEPHQIPNAVFGFISGQNCPKILVRILFPRLVTKRSHEGHNYIDHKRMEVLYDQLVRKAVQAVLPRSLFLLWPLSWTSEQFRATRKSGHLVQTTYSVLGQHATEVFKEMHAITKVADELKDYRDFIVQIQVQGTKAGTSHGPIPRNESAEAAEYQIMQLREEALLKAVAPLDIMKLPHEQTFVDTAVTLHLADAGFSLLPKAAQHPWLLSAVTGISVHEAVDRFAEGGKASVYIDEYAHTGCYAGFRITFKATRQPSPQGVLYMQVYTSDKGLTSLKDGQYFAKHVEPREVLTNYPKVAINHYGRLLDSLGTAVTECWPIDSRVEIRTRLQDFMSVLQPLPADTIGHCFGAVRSEAAWHWKKIRVESCVAVLNNLWNTLPTINQDRIHAPLTLFCAVVWMGNATLNRPDDDTDFQTMADTICVMRLVNGLPVAQRPWVGMFIHSLQEEPTLRISSHRVLGTKTIARLFGIAGTYPDGDLLELIFGRRTSNFTEPALPVWGAEGNEISDDNIGKRPRASDIGPSKKQRLRIDRPAGEDVIAPEEPNIPEAPAGAAYESEEEDPEHLPIGPTNRNTINRIFKTMAGELLLKVCKLKGQDCRKISAYQCKQETFDTLKNPKELPRLFVCWRQVSDPERWDKTVRKLLPNRRRVVEIRKNKDGTSKTTYLQGLAQLSFYQDWENLLMCRKLTDQQKDQLVEFAQDLLSKSAGWLPLGAADRLWDDSGGGKAIVHGTPANNNRGIVVIINPSLECDTNLPGGSV